MTFNVSQFSFIAHVTRVGLVATIVFQGVSVGQGVISTIASLGIRKALITTEIFSAPITINSVTIHNSQESQ